MPYTPSLREIPLDQDPHKAVLDALIGDQDDESLGGEVDFSAASEAELAHLKQCPRCAALTGFTNNWGGVGDAAVIGEVG
jgi:hypothetical protein